MAIREDPHFDAPVAPRLQVEIGGTSRAEKRSRPHEELLSVLGRQPARALCQNGQDMSRRTMPNGFCVFLQLRAFVEQFEESFELIDEFEMTGVGRTQDTPPTSLAIPDAHLVEQRDARGKTQERIGERNVLVVPGRESDAGRFEKLTSIGLVPGDVQETEQIEIVTCSDRLRILRKESCHHITLATIVPIDAFVVEDHEVRSCRGGPLTDGIQRTWIQEVITVDEQHVFPGGLLEAEIAGHAEPDVLVGGQHPDARVASGDLVNDRGRAVGRAILDHDDLRVIGRLVENGPQALAHIAFNVVNRHDDAEETHR